MIPVPCAIATVGALVMVGGTVAQSRALAAFGSITLVTATVFALLGAA